MLRKIQPDDPAIKFPGINNAYPILNEIASPLHSSSEAFISGGSDSLYIEDLYGRIYSEKILAASHPYGRSDNLKYYFEIAGLEIVDDLRVPFRKIPIYSICTAADIPSHLAALSRQNPGHKILIRGQNKIYTTDRSDDEFEKLYGARVREPSFLPSHLRLDFDEYFLKSLWHSTSSILLHEACRRARASASAKTSDLLLDSARVRHTALFDPFALGIAQHYGLPSLGLDLTDNIHVASWFALNRVVIDSEGAAKAIPASSIETPTLFVFRCPPDSIFDYKTVRPRILGRGRPDSQSAWFGHVGWGNAKNQLASYLVCGFRLRPENIEDLPVDLCKSLFPAHDDFILDFFMDLKKSHIYEGEARRALDRLYFFTH